MALKITAWVLGSIFVLVLVVGCTLAVLLHSARFHQYLLKTVQARASAALGVRVQLHDFKLSLATLRLDLYGVTVDGASPYTNPPLLVVDHAEAGVRIVSLLRGKWYLESIGVDRPVARIFVDEHGVSNLPKFQSSGPSTSSSTSIFDLAIRHAVLTDGQFYLNDKKSVLAADLHNVEFQAAYNVLLQKYSGHLAYSDGHLYSGNLQPIPHDLEADFDATPSTFHLTHARLNTGPSQAVLTATVNNYSSPVVDGTYDVVIDGGQVGQILKQPTIPHGTVRLAGKLHYAETTNRALLNSLTVDGDLNSRSLSMKTSSMRATVANLAGHYSLTNGDVAVNDMHANLLGGYLTASGTMKDIANEMQSQMKVGLKNLSLAELRRAAGASATMPGISVAGRLNVAASATWKKALEGLVAQADTTIHGQIANTISGASAAVPLESAIHGRYVMTSTGAGKNQSSDGVLTLSKSYLRTQQTNLTLDGSVSRRSSLHVRLQADDLREVETLADLFRAPEPGKPLEPLGLEGTASFDGTVQGTVQAPHLAGQLVTSNLKVHGTAWKTVRAGLDADPSEVRIENAEFDPASKGKIGLNASAALAKWSLSKTSEVQVQLHATQLDLAELAKAAGQSVAVSGTLNADVNLHGSELHPAGNGSVNITNAVAYEQPVSALKVTFQGTGDDAHAELAVQTPAGSVQGRVSVRPTARTYTAQLSSNGIRLEKLAALTAHNVNANGTITLNASGEGSFDDPQGKVSLQLPQLVMQGQTIKGIDLEANVANHVARATLASSAVNTSIQAKATVNLTGDYEADATVDTQAIPLQPLLAVYAPDQAANVTGETEVHATLHGPLKDKNRLEAHLTIPTLKLGYGKDIQLAETAPIRVDYANGVVKVQRSAIRGTDTDLTFEGSIPTANMAAMAVTLQGTVNLQLAQLFDPDIQTAGELKFNLNSSGTTNYGGQINIVNASFASADAPVGMQRANGVLTLAGGRLTITSFQGRVGSGTFTAQGGVTLQPKLAMDVGLNAQGIRMLYPQGVRESIDADMRLTGDMDDALLAGSVNLSDISFTSAFDMNSLISQLSGGVESPPSAGFTQNLRLNLSVRSTNDIALVSRTLSVGGSANLQVRGTAANPVILGRINLTDGDIILNGDRFVLEGGTVQFVNPIETQPVVNVSLKTNIQQYDVYLRFNGPIDQLQTNYSSDPALPSADIINLLAFGTTTEASAQNSANTTTNQQATNLVASQVSSQVTSRISKIAGISQLSINPVLSSGSNQQTGANITIQQRVTGNLFVTFTNNVGATQTQTIQGQYQISPRVAVSATRDPNGGFAFDAIIKKTW